MNSVFLQVILYAFVAGASAVALGAALVVLGSRGGRWNGLAFAIGVVLGQVIVLALAYAVGTATLPVGDDPHETARALLELTLGVALLVGGAYVWSQPPDKPPKPNSRSKAVLNRLAHLNLPSVFVAGAALGLGPKRVALTVFAAATISAAVLGGAEETALSVIYVVVATAMVTVPVVLAIVFGTRAEEWMSDVERWLAAHRRPMTCYPLAILGVLVTLDGVLALAT
jgi:threonine/homoserine/homoserine lactone efflux protein